MPAERIVGLDVARALSVIGMVLVNFKIVMGASGSGPDWLIGAVGLLEGRAAATFVMLAGIGLSLMTARARDGGFPALLEKHRITLFKRAAFLFIVGALYTPIWPADILHFYGIYIAIAACLLTMSTRSLTFVTAGLTAAFPLLMMVFNYEANWNWETLAYADLWSFNGAIRHLFFNGFHPVIPWLGFLLTGLAIGRLDLKNPTVRTRLLLAGALTAVIAELAGRLLPGLLALEGTELAELFGTSPMPPLPLYMLAAGGTATVIITLSIALAERFYRAAWLTPFVRAGQLALTLYVAHVIIGMGALEALGMLENQTLAVSVAAALTFCLAGFIFAYLWLNKFKRGPVEMLMRKLAG